MSAVTIQQMADRVAGLMEERLGVPGQGLSEKLRRGGRALPRRVHGAAKELADLAEKSRNPKLMVQIDQGRVAQCYDVCVKHLSGLRPQSARMNALIRVASTVAMGLLVLGLVFVLVQRLRGQI